jgi:hypothetical protein
MRLLLVLALCASTLGSACASSSHHGATPATPPPSAAPASPARIIAATAPWRLTAPRSRAAAVTLDGRILVLGGLAGGASTASVLSIDPSMGAVEHAGALAQAVHDTAAAVVDGHVDVFGGGAAASTNAVQGYDSGVSRVIGRLPRPRSDLTAVVVGSTAYIVGGFDGSRVSPYVLATGDGSSFRIAGTLATGVRYPAVAALGSVIYIAGGSTATTESSAADQVDLVQAFDTTTGKASIVAHLPHALAHASAFELGGQIFVAGGVEGRTPLAAIYRIDTQSGTITQPAALPGPRSDAAEVTVGGTAWLLGGEDGGPGAPLDTVAAVRASS